MLSSVLQVWADSFHEGDWACEQLGVLIEDLGGSHRVEYVQGFQPLHHLELGGTKVDLLVFGSYRAWSALPASIESLLAWGRPDFVFFDPKESAPLFAVEETAATPTGNQALQRCERQFGAARSAVPFWYLLSESGMHSDGNLRNDSIWPTVTALKLTQSMGLPSVVLHYSDEAHPEDYSAGTGLRSLFGALLSIVLNHVRGHPKYAAMESVFVEQYSHMLKFIERRWATQLDFLPGHEALADPALATHYSQAAMGDPTAEQKIWHKEFLVWPLASQLSLGPSPARRQRVLLRHDELSSRLESDIDATKAYGLSASHAGSRPQPEDDLTVWIRLQEVAFAAQASLFPDAVFSLAIDSFPASATGLRHVSTGARILYLYDSWSELVSTISAAYPRLRTRLAIDGPEQPAVLYISNSIVPGRIYGDPFTGQVAAFAVSFGHLDMEPRRFVAYYPHQVKPADFSAQRGKGFTVLRELVDVIIYHGGIAVFPATGHSA